MNFQPPKPAVICQIYGHEFESDIQQVFEKQWFLGKGMVQIYRNLCVRCDNWYHVNASGDLVEMRD